MSSHNHWDYCDGGEVAAWAAVEQSIRNGAPVLSGSTEFATAVALAHSYGYAEADNYLSRDGGQTDYDKAVTEMYNAYTEGEYFGSLDKTESLLVSAAGDDHVLLASAHSVCAAARDAFEGGRKMRESENAPKP